MDREVWLLRGEKCFHHVLDTGCRAFDEQLCVFFVSANGWIYVCVWILYNEMEPDRRAAFWAGNGRGNGVLLMIPTGRQL